MTPQPEARCGECSGTGDEPGEYPDEAGVVSDCRACDGTGTAPAPAEQPERCSPCPCGGCEYGKSRRPLANIHEFSDSCTCCRDRCGGTGYLLHDPNGNEPCVEHQREPTVIPAEHVYSDTAALAPKEAAGD